jgi:hypothetical protein
MNLLLHVYSKPVSCVVDGILHTLEPGVPYNMEEHLPKEQGTGQGSVRAPDSRPVNVPFITKAVIDHLWWAGVVRVPTVRTRFGTDDVNEECIAEATQLAEAALLEADQQTFNEYRENQIERGREGRTALVPSGRYLEVIERRGIDIRKYGINPQGAVTIEEQSAQGMEVAQLRKQLAEQGEQIAQLLRVLQGQQAAAAAEVPEHKTPRKKAS